MIQPRADSTGTPEVFKGLVVPDGRGSGLLEVGVRDGACVAGCGADAEPEEVADSADVAAVGVDLLEDSVLAQGLWAEVGVGPRELSADGPEPWCVAHADEKVRVDAARPFDRPVVEPCGESTEDGVGEGDVPVVDVEASVDDVGELKVLHFFGGEGVKGDQSDGEGGGWVWGVQGLADRFGVERERHRGVHPGCRHSGGGVGEDQLSAFEDAEQRPQPVLGEVALRSALGQCLAHLCLCDLGEGPVPVGGPGVEDRGDSEDVDASGLWVAFAVGALWSCRPT